MTERPQGSPAMMILLVLVLGPSLVVGQLAGAGGASIIGGFVALFTLIASMGGPLVADLRRMGGVGPLIAFGAVAPRLLSEQSTPASFALTTVMVFVAGLLPLLGRRYDAVGLGLGMGTLFGYSMPIQGGATALELVLAALVGLAVAAVLRLLIGLRDPEGPTREAVAALLDDPDADLTSAFDAWSSGRAPRWLAEVMSGAVRYQLARRVLSSDSAPRDPDVTDRLDSAQERAAGLAMTVRAKATPDVDGTDLVGAADSDGAEPQEGAASALVTALDDVQRAARQRDPARVAVPSRVRLHANAEAVRTALWDGSVQVRHAARASLAVLLALLVSTRLETGDPLVPTLLMTTFALVQVSWSATWVRVRDRLVGLLIGGVAVVLVVLVLPGELLLPVSVVGLGIGMWFITARPAIGVAGIIVMSVGINTELRDLDPGAVAIEYVVLTLVAVLVGGLVGFVVVPAWRPPALSARIDIAVAHSAALLESVATGQRAGGEQVSLVRAAQSSIQQLVPDRGHVDEALVDTLGSLQTSLRDLLATALLAARGPDVTTSTGLRAGAAILRGAGEGAGSAAIGSSVAGLTIGLAHDAASRRSTLRAQLSQA